MERPRASHALGARVFIDRHQPHGLGISLSRATLSSPSRGGRKIACRGLGWSGRICGTRAATSRSGTSLPGVTLVPPRRRRIPLRAGYKRFPRRLAIHHRPGQPRFPDTVFLLEGLGGPGRRRNLLGAGGMQWAYSGLFQNHTAEDVQRYFDYSISQSDGWEHIHYSGPTTTTGLHVRGRAWSLQSPVRAREREGASATCGSSGSPPRKSHYAAYRPRLEAPKTSFRNSPR